MSPFMYSIKKNISNNYTTKVDEKREEIDLYLISDQEHCICEKFIYFAKKGQNVADTNIRIYIII